jgi:hypothetical protein
MATVENFVLRFKTEGAGGIKNLAGDLQSLGDSMNPLSNTTSALTGRLGVLGNAAFAGAAAFTALGLKAINLADQLGDLSDATGVSAGSLLNLKETMIAAGGNSESYIKAVTKLSVAVGEAADGNEKYQKAFEKLGVYVTDASGKVRDGGDIMDDVIKQLAGIEDPAVRASRAVELLGKEASKIDWSKVSAGKDAITDEQVKQLAKYREEMDKVIAQFEKGLIKYFGDLAITINSGGIDAGLAKIIEQVGKLTGQLLNLPTDAIAAGWNALVPDWLRIEKAMGLGDPLIALSKKAEKERQAAMAGAGRGGQGGPTAAQLATANGSTTTPGKGGYGATPEATLKAIADSQLRIKQSRIDAEKQLELRGQGDIAQIEINAKYEAAKAKEEINAKERLSTAQKNAEYAAKEKEIFAKRDTDIAKNRLQTELRVMKEIADEAEKNAQEMGAYYQQVDQARLQAFEQVDAIKKQSEELKGRFELQQRIVDLGTIEQDRQTKLFDLEQQRKQQLDSIAKIKDFPYDERIKKEQEINAEYEKRIELINKESDARMAREQDFSAGVKESMKRYSESLTPLKQGAAMADAVYGNMGSAVDRFVETGKFKFSDFATSVIQDLIKIQMRAAATQLFNSVLGTFGFPLPGKAAGGPVLPNTPYIVGERGPEVFLPKSAGNIVPNNKLGSSGGSGLGGGTSVVYNINAVDSMSFKQLVARDPGFLYSVTEQGRKTIPSTRR